MKKIIAILLCAGLLLTLCACGKSKAAAAVDEQIAQLDPVTIDSAAAIAAAEDAYAALSDEDRQDVENYHLLTDARTQFEDCVVSDFVTFVAEHPYPYGTGDYTQEYRVDIDLLAQYREKMDFYDSFGLPHDRAADSFAEVERALELEQYAPDLEFLKGYLQAKEILTTAFGDMSNGLAAYTSGRTENAVTLMNSAVDGFDAALETLQSLDQSQDRVADYISCVSDMRTGAQQLATGMESGNVLVLNSAVSFMTDSATAYSQYLIDAETLLTEISDKEAELQNG